LKYFDKIINFLLPLIIGVELLILVIGNNSPKEILFNLQDVLKSPSNLALIILSMSIGYLSEVLRGIRWKILIDPIGYKVKYIDLINSCAAGYMFNAVIPRSGELARCTMLKKASNIPITYLFGHVLIERVIDLIILMFCVLTCIIYKWNVIYNYFHENIIISKSLTSVLIYFLIVFSFFSFFSLSIRKKVSSLKSVKWLFKYLKKIKIGALSIFTIKEKNLFIFYTLMIWLCYLFMTFICFWCFKSMHEFNIMDGLLIMTIGGIGMVIPTPGGMGSYHGAVFIGLHNLLNQSAEIATTFGFLVHGAQTTMIVIMGLVAFIMISVKKHAT
tara:strand:- start:403 stop:1392 length:990 start_codon:yes stop_codon:yes gene_type:complete